MLKQIIKYSLSGLILLGSLASCNKEQNEPLAMAETSEPKFGFELTATASAPGEGDLRLASYDLVGEKKKLELNFLHIKNIINETNYRSYGISNEENMHKVPVHLIFINTKIGIGSRRYYLKYMDIVNEKTLHLPFQDYPGIRAQYKKENADHWYVKAFIGGTINSTNEENGNSLFFMMDNLASCDPEQTSYITRSIVPYSGRKEYQLPLPFPMETPWRKVNFFFNSDDTGVLDDNPDGNYPNQLQTFDFKPIGALMRLQIHNERQEDLPVTVFHFSPAPLRNGSRINKNSSPNPDDPMKAEQIYVNSINRVVDALPPHDPVTKYLTAEALTDHMVGAKTEINRDGDVHYHSKRFNNPIGNNNHQVVYIKAGSSRTFFFWLFEDHINNTNKQDAYVMPFFHNTYNSNNLINGRHGQGSTVPNGSTTVPYKPIYLGSTTNDHCIIVRRGQYENGKTYFIKSTLRNKQ